MSFLHNSSFVANMEMVLDVYKRPFDPRNPVVFTDYEYKRNGICEIFLACEPLIGKRMIKTTERKTMQDLAYFPEEIELQRENTDKITLVMDNLNTHVPGSLYETFPPAKAKALWDRFEFVYTPKHGSWLSMREIELNVLTGQCLKRRMDNIEFVRKEVLAWQNFSIFHTKEIALWHLNIVGFIRLQAMKFWKQSEWSEWSIWISGQ